MVYVLYFKSSYSYVLSMYNLVMGIHYIAICNLVHLNSREKQNIDQHGLWLLKGVCI